MATVAIVEDTTLQSTLVHKFIEGQHTVVGTAREGNAAVELVQETNPDAVIMDLNLASGNGIDATEAIKAFDPSIGVVVSTVHVSNDVFAEAIEAGADEYLSKPYSK